MGHPTRGCIPRGTVWGSGANSIIRNSAPFGLYSRNMPRALWWSQGGGLILKSEVPLYTLVVEKRGDRRFRDIYCFNGCL